MSFPYGRKLGKKGKILSFIKELKGMKNFNKDIKPIA
jgi:hypothetical protein